MGLEPKLHSSLLQGGEVYWSLSTICSATATRSKSRRALKGRGRDLRSTRISSLTEIMKLPFPGFSLLISKTVFGTDFETSSTIFFVERPNTPHDLHASIFTTAVLPLGFTGSARAVGFSGTSRFRFAPILPKYTTTIRPNHANNYRSLDPTLRLLCLLRLGMNFSITGQATEFHSETKDC